jgi:HSP20 family protein
MTLVKYNRNRLSPRFPSLFDEFFGRDAFDLNPWHGQRPAVPAVNIREEDDHFAIELAAPGLKKEDFQVALNDNTLTIKSERQVENEETNDEQKFTRREFSYQAFERSFTLPETVDTEGISARYEDGVLLLTLPRKAEAQVETQRTIEIG